MVPIPESPGAWRPVEESTAAVVELGGGERLAPTAATIPEATAGASKSSEADARIADAAAESRAEEPVAPEEQGAPLEMMEGMVGRVVQPPSPQVAPPTTKEEVEVEEIERDES